MGAILTSTTDLHHIVRPSDDEVRIAHPTITAKDGYALATTLFEPTSPARGTVMLSSGTGIPRGFYRRFASYLASEGWATLTYDYRGIGESRPERLSGFSATKQDWAQLDQSAAFATLQKLHPDVPHFVLGHSVGAQLIGLMDQVHNVDGVVSIGTSYGYWGNMPRPYRYFVWTMWYAAIPLGTSLFGFMPAKRFGLGEDLPTGVAKEWARWGKRKSYFAPEFAHHPGFRALRAPWKAFLLKDDQISTPENARPLYALYPNARVNVEVVDPLDHGLKDIGHLGFFSRSRQTLWPLVSEWLAQTACRRLMRTTT